MVKEKTKKLIICIAIPLATGALSGFLTRNGMAEFQALRKPPLTPPGWVFPVAWTVLYILMGIASCLIVRSEPSAQRTKALWLYWIQLAMNFLWPIFFFEAGWFLFSFIWLLLLWYLVYLCIKKFSAISKTAGYLLVPYIIWLTFAAYLNLFISMWNT